MTETRFPGGITGGKGVDLELKSDTDIVFYPQDHIWISQGTKLIFEGTVPDDFEAKLQATSVTADRDIILPDASGTITLNEQLQDGSFDLDVNSLTVSGAGSATLSSQTNISLAAGVRVSVTTSPFKLARFNTVDRDALISEAGDMIYNTDTNKFQGYTDDSDGLGTPGWVDLS